MATTAALVVDFLPVALLRRLEREQAQVSSSESVTLAPDNLNHAQKVAESCHFVPSVQRSAPEGVP